MMSWTNVVPVLAVVVLALAWGRGLPPAIVGVVTVLLAAYLFLAFSP
jgi:Ca2+:H+ antiporter